MLFSTTTCSLSPVSLPPLPLFQGTFVGVVLNICTIRFDGSITTSFNIFLTIPPRETPFLRSEDLLTTRELELRTSQCFNCSGLVVVFATDRHQGLTDVDASNRSLGFTVSSSHSCLEPISSSTRQHFVDAYDVEGMDSHADVEGVFTSDLGHVFVGADTGCFQGFCRQLLIFIRHQVDTLWKLIDTCLLLAKIEDSNLWVWYTSTETRLGVGFVLAVAVTTSWTTTHFIASIALISVTICS